MNATVTRSRTTSYESFLAAARSSVWIQGDNPIYTHEDIAARAFAEQSCVRHAAYGLYVERSVFPACSFCGGRTEPRQGGFHEVCKIRSERGRAVVPVLDSVRPCSCAKCSPGLRFR